MLNNHDCLKLMEICDNRKDIVRAYWNISTEDESEDYYIGVIVERYECNLLSKYEAFYYLWKNVLKGTKYEEDLIKKGVLNV